MERIVNLPLSFICLSFDLSWVWIWDKSFHVGKCVDSDHRAKYWKRNFRCAMQSLKDVRLVADMGSRSGADAYVVYQFLPEMPKRRGRREQNEPSLTDVYVIYNIGRCSRLLCRLCVSIACCHYPEVHLSTATFCELNRRWSCDGAYSSFLILVIDSRNKLDFRLGRSQHEQFYRTILNFRSVPRDCADISHSWAAIINVVRSWARTRCLVCDWMNVYVHDAIYVMWRSVAVTSNIWPL